MLDRFTPGQPHFDPALLVMAVGLLVLLTWTILLTFRLGSLRKRYGQLLASPTGEDLEGMLREYLAAAQEAREAAARAEEDLKTLVALQKACLQRVGVVRFDAFDDTGGRLSFSVALADEAGNGILLTSVYGREGCRIYAKRLEEGGSETPLSEEERETVRKAMSVSSLASNLSF